MRMEPCRGSSVIDVTFSATDKVTTVVTKHPGFYKCQNVDIHDKGCDRYIVDFKWFLLCLDKDLMTHFQ